MIKRRQLPALFVGTFVAAITLAACVPEDTSGSGGSGDGPIKIGLLAQMTGTSAADGRLMQQGAQLAADEVNEAGGVLGRDLELVTADVQDQQPDAVSAAVAEFVNDPDVEVVVGGYPSATNFEIDLLAEADMPYLIGGNSDQTREIVSKDPEAYPTIWSFSGSFDGYSTGLPESVSNWAEGGEFQPRNGSAYIVSSDNPYSNGIAYGLAENFKELGWEVGGPEVVPFGQVNDWGTQLEKIRQADPDVVINTDHQVSNGATFLEQFVQQPTESLLFIQYGPSVPEFLELTQDAADGLLYNMIGGAIQSEKAERSVEVTEKFTAAYDTDPGVYGVVLYEEVMAYVQALEEVGDPDAHLEIGDYFASATFDTAMGTVEFDPDTHLAKTGAEYIPLQLFQIQDGERVLLEPEQYSTGDFELPHWMQ